MFVEIVDAVKFVVEIEFVNIFGVEIELVVIEFVEIEFVCNDNEDIEFTRIFALDKNEIYPFVAEIVLIKLVGAVNELVTCKEFVEIVLVKSVLVEIELEATIS
jgi:hypothetical protein